jgi:hypothetical protein
LFAINAVLRFALEIAGLAALAVWGWSVTDSPARWVLAIGAPLVLVLIWARWIAPNSNSPLAPNTRTVVGSGLLLVAAVALWAAGDATAAWVFAGLNVLNTAMILLSGRRREDRGG